MQDQQVENPEHGVDSQGEKFWKPGRGIRMGSGSAHLSTTTYFFSC